jgi:SsrA-binding protein
MKTIANNRKAKFNYTFIEIYNAGIILLGTEVKPARLAKVNIDSAFIFINNNELFIKNMHIEQYKESSYQNHDEIRDRKLLLKKTEIRKISDLMKNKGLSLIPTELYLNEKGIFKLKFAVCKSKKMYDKRNDLKKKTVERELQQNG